MSQDLDSPITSLLTTRQAPRKPPPPEVEIAAITSENLSSFRRLTALLIPIRYPESFFKTTITSTAINNFSRVALWGKESKVIAAIRCVAEVVPPEGTTAGAGWEALMKNVMETDKTVGTHRLYLSVLFTLSPYRNLGIASALLEEIVRIAQQDAALDDGTIGYIYAHVWEANEEALSWYQKNNFVDWGFVDNYYSRLKPSGARVLRRWIIKET